MNELKYLEKEKIDSDKLNKVIFSCETKEQFQCALRYFALWKRKYRERLDSNVLSSYREGKAVGIFVTLLKMV